MKTIRRLSAGAILLTLPLSVMALLAGEAEDGKAIT
jgi:hypothetical protein